jgi:hypothetical protein
MNWRQGFERRRMLPITEYGIGYMHFIATSGMTDRSYGVRHKKYCHQSCRYGAVGSNDSASYSN